jgi:hypothetical protein
VVKKAAMTHASTGAIAGAPVQQTGEVYPRGSGRVRTEITLAVKTFTGCGKSH